MKPEGYRATRASEESKSALAENTSPQSVKRLLDLKIQLLSGQDIPLATEKESSHRTKIKPYVKIEVHTDTHGPPGRGASNPSAKTQSGAYAEDDKDEKKYKFRSKTQKSDCPNFDGETAAWSGIPDVVEQLSFVRYVNISCYLSFKIWETLPGFSSKLKCLTFV